MKAFIFSLDSPLASYISEELRAKGYDVYGTSDKPDKIKSFKLNLKNFIEIENLLDRLQPSVIFHLETSEDKLDIDITKNIIDAAEELDKSPSVVLLSSAEVYGRPKVQPIPEEHPLQPNTEYGRLMLQAENLARDSAKKGFRVLITRVFNYLIEDAKHGQKAKSAMDIVHAKDLAKALITAAEKGDSGDPYNVCSARTSQPTGKIISYDSQNIVGDNRKFFRKTGWRPLILV
jgi:nucleoside-diphosphate-sugar epimerase